MASTLETLFRRSPPAELREHLRKRNWTNANIAHALGKSLTYITSVISDANRPLLYEKALAALPYLNRLEARELTQRRLHSSSATPRKPEAAARSSAPRFGVATGDVVVTMDDVGEDLQEGCRGVVELVGQDACRVMFEGGRPFTFSLQEFNRYLCATGETR